MSTHTTSGSGKLRVLFAGTPECSVPCLDALIASGHDIVGVYTQPDRPSGRGRAMSQSAVKQRAIAANLDVFQPMSLRDPTARRELESLRPDLMVVVAYGLILTSNVLAVPRLGCWNVHASILPRWRGAAPIQRALLAGDTETGVDLMQMEKGLDTGPVLLSRRTLIADSDTGGSLHDRLSSLGAEVLGEGMRLLESGRLLVARPQADEGVCYAQKIEKHEAILDFGDSAVSLERKVRAFSPWPIAETTLLGERVRVHAATAVPSIANGTSGTIAHVGKLGIDIVTADGWLRITRLQREGGKPISAADYANARTELRRSP